MRRRGLVATALPLSALMFGLSTCGVRTKQTNTAADEYPPRPDAQASRLNLFDAPSQEEMLTRKITLAGQILGRVTATSDAYRVGYHTAHHTSDAAEQQLEKNFFADFWAGKYSEIEKHRAAYSARLAINPNSALINARLAFLNIWQFSERYRLWNLPADQRPVAARTDGTIAFDPQTQINLFTALGSCDKHFSIAAQLEPADSIYKGFAADCAMFSGQGVEQITEQCAGSRASTPECSLLLNFTKDPATGKDINAAERRFEGLKMASESIQQNPDFNLFTVGYVLSSLNPNNPKEKPQFDLGLEMMFRNLEVCFAGALVKREVNPLTKEPITRFSISRSNPDIRDLLLGFSSLGNKSYCANTEVAPYNFEGFFLILGDLLVKSGNLAAAKIAYNNAKLLPSYATWPHRDKLELRLASLVKTSTNDPAKLTEAFAAPIDPMVKPAYPTITFNTEYSCMACHQKQVLP